MSVWITELLSKSPFIAMVAVVARYGYKAVVKLIESPLSVATILGVVGTRRQREAALVMIRLYRGDPGSGPGRSIGTGDDDNAPPPPDPG